VLYTGILQKWVWVELIKKQVVVFHSIKQLTVGLTKVYEVQNFGFRPQSSSSYLQSRAQPC
jgi:hypothetical protein